MAPAVNLISWNVMGMGDASKRCAIFTYLKLFYPGIICLSDTHLLKDKMDLLQKPWVGHSIIPSIPICECLTLVSRPYLGYHESGYSRLGNLVDESPKQENERKHCSSEFQILKLYISVTPPIALRLIGWRLKIY